MCSTGQHVPVQPDKILCGTELKDDTRLSTARLDQDGAKMRELKPSEPEISVTRRLTATQLFLRGLGRIIMTAFYSRIEVVNAESFPTSGPVLVVSNHENSLVDGVLVSCYLPRMPRLLAASTIWDYKPLTPLLKAARVVPIYRQQDVGLQLAKEMPLFDRSSEALMDDGVLSVFPEGLSHNHPHLLPLKNGAARIALEAEAKGDRLGIQVVPVGLTFEDKSTFRSKVLLQVGDPIDITRQADAFRETSDVADRRTLVRDLTDRIQRSLYDVTLNFGSWKDAQLVRQATELWQRTDTWAESGADEQTIAAMRDRVRMQQTFARGYAWLDRNRPDLLARATSDLERYLAARGDSEASLGAVRSLTLRWPRATLLALYPMWLIGAALNFFPFHLSRWFAHGKDEDKMATWSLFSSLLLFPGFWGLQALALGGIVPHAVHSGFNWPVFWSTLILAPAAGFLSLTYLDLRKEVRERKSARAELGAEQDLQHLRSNLAAQLEELVHAYVNRPEAKARRRKSK